MLARFPSIPHKQRKVSCNLEVTCVCDTAGVTSQPQRGATGQAPQIDLHFIFAWDKLTNKSNSDSEQPCFQLNVVPGIEISLCEEKNCENYAAWYEARMVGSDRVQKSHHRDIFEGSFLQFTPFGDRVSSM